MQAKSGTLIGRCLSIFLKPATAERMTFMVCCFTSTVRFNKKSCSCNFSSRSSMNELISHTLLIRSGAWVWEEKFWNKQCKTRKKQFCPNAIFNYYTYLLIKTYINPSNKIFSFLQIFGNSICKLSGFKKLSCKFSKNRGNP